MTLKGGIIGCGYFGMIQVEAWRRMPDVELAAACDLQIDRARKAAPRAYRSAEEMLDREKLDFVDIATRPDSHLPLTRLAMDRKVATICQKPMAPGWPEAAEMVKVVEAAGVPFMIHENWRWQAWYRAAKRLIESGEIGAPIAYWFRTRRRDGIGPQPYSHQPYFAQMPRLLIYETLVHHIDTASFLFGNILRVYAQARRLNPAIAGEDQALILLTHTSGLQGFIDGHRYLDPDPPDSPPLGDAGFEGDQAALHVSAAGDIFKGRQKVWTNDVKEGYRGDSVRATQQHFIDCLKSARPFESGAREYLRTFAAVEAAYRSAAERRAVELSELLSRV